MSKIAPRDFPEEDQHGIWPLLKPTRKDMTYMPTPKPPLAQQSHQPQQPRSSVPMQSNFLKLLSPIPKGAILGIFVFGLVYSFLPLQTFWLSSWHWVYPIIAIAVLILFIGVSATFVILLVISTVTAAWLNRQMIITTPIIPLIFVGSGIVVLYIRRLLPQRAQ